MASVTLLTQNYSYNGRDVSIDLTTVPVISRATRDIFENLGSPLPTCFHDPSYLMDKFRKIQTASRMLHEAKATGVRRKIFAILKTAASVAIIAGTILGVATGSETGRVLSGVFGGISHAFLSYYFWYKSTEQIRIIENNGLKESRTCLGSCDHQDNGWAGIFWASLGPGICISLYEAFSQEARLTRILREQNESLAKELAAYRASNIQNLPNAYLFYKNHSALLLTLLEQVIETANKHLASLSTLPRRDALSELALGNRLQNYIQAKEELTQVQAFYQRFDPVAEEIQQ